MNNKVEVYSSFYKPYYIYNDDVIKPFFVGASEKKNSLGIPGDDTGDNISDKNGTFNELTLLYWVWKNTQNQDYVGFCHYRRYFVNYKVTKVHKLFNLFFSKLIDKEKKVDAILRGFSTEIKDSCAQYDIILPKPVIMERTLREQYGDYHDLAHYDLMGDIIKERRPDVYDSFIDASNRNAFFIANMFIFKREIFNQFCEFAFPILFELEKKILIPEDSYQKRIFGYLGERMVTIFVNYLTKVSNPKVKYIDIINTDVFFGNFKSYLTERKSLYAKNFITFGHVDTVLNLNDNTFSINGWCIVKNQSSHDYLCKLELYNDKNSFIYNTEVQMRRDTTLAFTRENKKYINYDSSGFYTLVSKKQIPSGKYKIKLYMKAKSADTECRFYVIDCYLNVEKNKVDLIRI
ncbi:DUF4422 domain-containing protein [Ewingella americana]